jgi:hypothetical protein
LCSQGNSDACSIAWRPFEADAQHRRRVVRPKIRRSGKHLTQNPRFTHASNINCTCESCGKPKATLCARFFLAARRGFSAAQLWRPIAPALVSASRVPEHRRASATLNDTESRKNFRRKNTARKCFLGHALQLNDLPVEAATGPPYAGFAAHRREFRRPTVGDWLPPSCPDRVTGARNKAPGCRT